jgi:hypothetical protein
MICPSEKVMAQLVYVSALVIVAINAIVLILAIAHAINRRS